MFYAYPQGEIQLTALCHPCLPASFSAPSVGGTPGLTHTNIPAWRCESEGEICSSVSQNTRNPSSSECWMSLLSLTTSLWSQPPPEAPRSRVWLEVFGSRGPWAKEGGSEVREWLLHYAASSHNKGVRFWSACWSLLFLLWYLVVSLVPTSV